VHNLHCEQSQQLLPRNSVGSLKPPMPQFLESTANEWNKTPRKITAFTQEEILGTISIETYINKL